LSDVDKAYVNQIAQGKTTIGKAQIADKYYRAIAHAIGLDIEPTYWKHFDTKNYVQASLAINNARKNRERLGLDGNTGLGKTYIATDYKRSFPKECILVKCSGNQSAREFAKDLATACGISEVGSKSQLIKNACKTIKNTPNAFVIIDEFENAPMASIIPIIKELADELEGVVPVILIGINVQEMLQKAYERGRNGFVQVNRRWAWKWTKMEADISEDIELICEELGVELQGAKNWLMGKIKDFDSLKNVLTTALKEAQETNQNVNNNLLTQLFTV